MHIHTIGDRAVRESLDAIESAQKTNGNASSRRHRLTHVEVVNPSDIGRFKSLGVIADFQVAGDFALPANYADVEPLIGVVLAGTIEKVWLHSKLRFQKSHRKITAM